MSDTLEGIRILDLTRVLAGPYGTMLLADMGAEVIKIEDPGGDPIRAMGPPFVNGQSAYFLGINRNKRSIGIDLKQESGRELFYELAAVSDVVIENFRPGVMERLGIGPDRLREHNPRLVTCAISAFGSDGPYRDLPGFDLIIQAMSGGMSITGEPLGNPVRMGIPLGDLAGGLMGALAVCAALVRRATTGTGQHIDLSLLDAQVSLLTYVAQYHFADGRIPGPIGSGHQTLVPYQAFDTADVQIVVAPAVEHFWPPLCEAIERPDLIERWPTNADRRKEIETVVGEIQGTLRTKPSAYWLERLHAARVPAAPVNTVDRVLVDPQVRHREMVDETSRPHPIAGDYPVLGNPIKVGADDEFEPAPLLGEHTVGVLRDMLGHDERRIRSLIAEGVVIASEVEPDGRAAGGGSVETPVI